MEALLFLLSIDTLSSSSKVPSSGEKADSSTSDIFELSEVFHIDMWEP